MPINFLPFLKKIFSFFFLLAFLYSDTFSQPTIISNTENTAVRLVSSTERNSVIEFTIGKTSLTTVQTPSGTEYKVELMDATPVLKKGAPDLPKLTSSLIIPDNGLMQAKVVSSSFTDYENVSIAPSKGSLTRTTDISQIPFTYGKEYSTDEFFPNQTVTLRDPYILRDWRGQTVVVNPVQYNPVTKVLRVYDKITVEVKQIAQGAVVANPFLRTESPLPNSRFSDLYKNQFLNFKNDEEQLRYIPVTEENRMLIICYGEFMSTMSSFVEWKQQEGIHVDMVDVKTIGSRRDIKNYVANYYHSKGLTYLLLIGDAAQVPPSITGAGTSDNDYGYIVGNDHYPDIFTGRFSAENVSQLQTQINRTLTYEKSPVTGEWFSRGVCVASNEHTQGDDDEYDWEHLRKIRNQLLGSTYTDVAELFDGTHPDGVDIPGNPKTGDLLKVLNDGTSVMNYTGHGNVNVILTSGFTNNSIRLLNNANKLPFVWIVGCQTGNFLGNECFSEVLMRSKDASGQPIGSIANFCSTIDQYWDEPMEAQDVFNTILTDKTITSRILRTFGGISFNGCISMNDKYGETGFDMTDTWVCFGDPSLLVRTDIPEKITAAHTPFISSGITSFHVSCNTENAQVCLYAEGGIIGVGKTSAGGATVNLSTPLSASAGSVWLTITAFNKIPYQIKIPLITDRANTNAFNVYPNVIRTGYANISYQVVNNDLISVKLYNAMGQVVKTFIDREVQPTGIYKYEINPEGLSSGIYIAELVVGNDKFYKKVLVN